MSSDGGSSGGGWRWMTKYRACHASSENTLLQGISGHSRPSMLRCKTRQTMIISKASAGSRRSRFSSCSASIRQPLFNEEKKKKDTKKKKHQKEKKRKRTPPKRKTRKKQEKGHQTRKMARKRTPTLFVGNRSLVCGMPWSCPCLRCRAVGQLRALCWSQSQSTQSKWVSFFITIAINAIKVGVLFYYNRNQRNQSGCPFLFIIKVGVLFYSSQATQSKWVSFFIYQSGCPFLFFWCPFLFFY
jgi:hypothetical protein